MLNLTIEQVKEFVSTLEESEQRAIANEILSQLGIIAHGWGIVDVIYQGRECGYDLTKEQAREILEDIDKNHDASIGINWEVIDIYVEQFVDDSEPGEVAEWDTEQENCITDLL